MSRRARRVPALALALVLAPALASAFGVGCGPGPTASAPPPPAVARALTPAPGAAPAAERPLRRAAPLARDPFAAGWARERWAALDVRLEGLVAAGSDGPARALAAGRTLAVGDRLDRFEVAAIESAALVLRDPCGERLRLDLRAAGSAP